MISQLLRREQLLRAALLVVAGVLLVFWGILYWMYRRRIFIRI